MRLGRRLLYLLIVLLSPLLMGQGQSTVVCTTSSPGTVVAACGGAALSSPVTTPDPLTWANVNIFDNAPNTPITCSDGVIDSTLTAGRVTLAGAAGRLVDDLDLTFATDTLTATNMTVATTLTSPNLVSAAGVTEAISSTAPTQVAASVAGSPVTITASNATAGASVAGAAAGGSITLAAGNADRLTSGNANGGDVNLTPGTGIGTGAAGQVIVSEGSAAAPGGITFGNNQFTLTSINANQLSGYISPGGSEVFNALSNVFRFNSAVSLGWTNTAAASASADTTITRGAAGFVALPERFLTAATMTAENRGQLRTTTHSYTWTNAQVVALGAALTGDINVATLPAKTQVLDAMVVITGQGAGTTTLTVSCGDAIGGTPFVNLVGVSDAQAAVNTVYGDAVAERGAAIDSEFWYLPSYTATTLVTCHFISTVQNLDQVTGSTGRVILTTRLLP